ncbi:MAG TPA: hypothetical protein VIG38_04185 [Hyphomicrobium sp.]
MARLETLHHGAEFDDGLSVPLGDTHRAAVKASVEGQNVHRPQPYTQSTADSPSENEGRISNDLRHFIEAGRGDRGFNTDGSPYPRLHRKFDLMLLPAKDAARLRHGRSHWFHIEEKNPAEATGLY